MIFRIIMTLPYLFIVYLILAGMEIIIFSNPIDVAKDNISGFAIFALSMDRIHRYIFGYDLWEK